MDLIEELKSPLQFSMLCMRFEELIGQLESRFETEKVEGTKMVKELLDSLSSFEENQSTLLYKYEYNI